MHQYFCHNTSIGPARSINGGVTEWEAVSVPVPLGNPSIEAARATVDGLIMVCKAGTVHVSEDGGDTFSTFSGAPINWVDDCCITNSHWVGVDYGGVVWRCPFGGSPTSNVPGGSVSLTIQNTLLLTQGDYVLVVARDGYIGSVSTALSADGGATWGSWADKSAQFGDFTPYAAGFFGTLAVVSGLGASDGLIYTSPAPYTTWTLRYTGVSGSPITALLPCDDRILAWDRDTGQLYQSLDGTTWASVSGAATYFFAGGASALATRGVWSAADGVLLPGMNHSSDYGFTFTDISGGPVVPGLSIYLLGMSGAAPTRFWTDYVHTEEIT